MYEPRTYRHWIRDDDLVSFIVVVRETDLFIRARSDLKQIALDSIIKCRAQIEHYIETHPLFQTTFEPYQIEKDAPPLIKSMAKAALTAGVGPMAAVAGVIAESIGRDLLLFSPEVIVENGGDIFAVIQRTRNIGIYAGKSPFTGKIALEINPADTPLGICTSSGTIGHSVSFGKADAVLVLSHDTALADAAATAIGNGIKTAADIDAGLERAKSIEGLTGAVIIKGDKIGLWGDIKLVSL
jgi:ApbE superfamily uncharacterized protein (UPF0280 family)